MASSAQGKQDLRVAVVGAGIMGADHIARIELKTVGAYVSAVIEPDEGRAKAAMSKARDQKD